MSIVENPYDSPELVQARKDEEDPWVLYLIFRESLHMTSGKIAAQSGHAVGMIYAKVIELNADVTLTVKERGWFDDYAQWSDTSYRKVALQADDKEWAKLKEQEECFLVVDAGLTEVASGSETCIALWPRKKSSRSKLLKRLRAVTDDRLRVLAWCTEQIAKLSSSHEDRFHEGRVKALQDVMAVLREGMKT